MREWEGQGYEKGQTQLFYREFFEIFGMPVRPVASFEEKVTRLGDRRRLQRLFRAALEFLGKIDGACHIIENAFRRLKDFRRIAMRYDKRGANFLSAVAITAVVAFWV